MAVRTRAALAWRFKYLLQEKSAIIVAMEEGQGISGYLILMRRKHEDPAVSRLVVADLQARDESPQIVEALLSKALHLAKERDVHMVGASGFSPGKRRAIARLRPYRLMFDHWQCFFRAADAPLQQALTSPHAWDLSMLDGDSIR